mgnify:FL=1
MNEESDMSSYQHPDVNRQKQNYLLQDHNHYNLCLLYTSDAADEL